MKINVSPSVAATQCNLSRLHATTLDFNQILPISAIDCIIGDKHTLDYSSFMRLAPLVYPTFGNMQLRFTSFFVPYYQVYDSFDDFVSGIGSHGNELLAVPCFKSNRFYSIFLYYGLSDAGAPNKYDFVYFDNLSDSSTIKYRTFTTAGRYVYKILQCLGYSFTNEQGPSAERFTYYSVLPILCFLKAYNDWMSLSATYNTSYITQFLRSYKSFNGDLTDSTNFFSLLAQALSNVRPLIGSDYFTSAYNYMQVAGSLPNTSNNSTVYLGNPAAQSVKPSVTADLTTIPLGNSLSTRQLNFLKSLDSWIRRNELAGTKAAQRIFSRFGLKSEDFRSNYAHLIDSQKFPIQVADVISNASTDNAALGSYAGQSVCSSNYKVSYECQDYGMLFTFVNIDVRAMYYDNLDASVLRNSPLDFYQPEFDGVGLEPISNAQLYSPVLAVSQDNFIDTIFGYTPRYEDYRTSYDKVTGDFVRYANMSPWHFGRDFSSMIEDNQLDVLPQSNAFQFVGTEFDKIFQSDSNDTQDTMADHFYCIFNCNHQAFRRMKSRANSLQMSDGDITLHSLGQTLQSM